MHPDETKLHKCFSITLFSHDVIFTAIQSFHQMSSKYWSCRKISVQLKYIDLRMVFAQNLSRLFSTWTNWSITRGKDIVFFIYNTGSYSIGVTSSFKNMFNGTKFYRNNEKKPSLDVKMSTKEVAPTLNKNHPHHSIIYVVLPTSQFL